ncbi:reprolysin-like metallopeptidase [Neptunomonas phycophila]|uniref:reprolysin-like metallopeptidase n=1 Tax=Neptunomonas phycophila TaxID=1572645 RepID=UPI001BE61010|nr:zinc-dependent metalloprotease family protein [Neptunomonas phycophila]MBT3146364.1 hypothetical protein [Neptunomonas phycophila]
MYLFKASLAAIFFTSTLTSLSSVAAPLNPWIDSNAPSVQAKSYSDKRPNVAAKQARALNADFDQLTQTLLAITDATPIDVVIPLPDGLSATYRLTLTQLMAVDLGNKYPNIKTFEGVDLANPANKGRFDITPLGFHGMFLHQGEWVLIDPANHQDTQAYLSYSAKNAIPLSTSVQDEALNPFSNYANNALQAKSLAQTTASGSQLRTYRIAVSATGEYTQFFGGTKANAIAGITTALNRVNTIFQQDLAVQLELVSNSDELIYTNPNTDPFVNNDPNSDIDTNMVLAANVLGVNAFDLGHVFTTTGSGLAYVGSVCDNSQISGGGYYKAGAVSGLSQPNSDIFYIGLLAHELGHQFGANHSFNGTQAVCSSGRNAETAWEPGSGSTIMSYSGLCESENIQNDSSAFFHGGSIKEIQSYLSGTSCAATRSLNNAAPTVSAGGDYIIPALTPFMLEASASDTNGDTLSYIWEELDAGSASSSAATMIDNGSGALFRSYEPTDSAIRYFPQLTDLLDDTTSLGEAYPTTNRDLNFQVTVRDGNGGVSYDANVITVDRDSGPFTVNSPVLNEQWTTGEEVSVEWDVAGTNTSPVNCPAVDILLSTDGGASFPTALLSGTTNNGEQTFVMPAVTSNNARLMVRCTNNIFFAINPGRFSIVSGGNTEVTTVDTDPYTTPTTEVTPPSSGSSNSGGGGGSIPPFALLALVIAGALSLTGCKTVASPHAPVDSHHGSHHHPSTGDTARAQADAKHAMEHNDYRFFAIPGREIILPGIAQQHVSSINTQYGTQNIPVSDALQSAQDKHERDHWIEYAAEYNRYLATQLNSDFLAR